MSAEEKINNGEGSLDEEKKLEHVEGGDLHGPKRVLTGDQTRIIESVEHGDEVFTLESLAAFADEHGYHQHRSGRYVLDPVEAKTEYGDKVASLLKTSQDGKVILWPQPTNFPEDPQNWPTWKKDFMLVIVAMAAFVPDFSSGLGIASLFPLAAQFDTTVDHINQLTSNWSIFLLGPGGVIAVWFVRRYGRLPVLFWSQVLACGFLIGCTVAQNLNTFAAMRCLAAFFGTAPQITGLYTVTDLYPFHLQARKINFWTGMFIISPFVSPWLGGYIAAATTWRWVYGWGVMYNGIVVAMIAIFLKETMYDRDVNPIPRPPEVQGMRYRIESLIGITGARMAKYRPTIWKGIYDTFDVFWRPQLLLTCIFVGAAFGFGIGINVTAVVFLGEPVVIGGRGFTPNIIATMYLTPLISVIIGELLGRFLNDGITWRLTRKNRGVYEAEMALWAWFVALPIYVGGFTLLGASLQNNLSVAGIIFGWGMAEVAIMIITVVGYSYLNACFPSRRGEASALLNLARTMFGFSVPYYQTTWAEEFGALSPFGYEALIVTGLFFLIVPLLLWKGKNIRNRFSITRP